MQLISGMCLAHLGLGCLSLESVAQEEEEEAVNEEDSERDRATQV